MLLPQYLYDSLVNIVFSSWEYGSWDGDILVTVMVDMLHSQGRVHVCSLII